MPATLACIAGNDIYRQWDAGTLSGEQLGPQDTPFGLSGSVFRIHPDTGETFYLLARTGSGMDAAAPHAVNHRANLYALKDLGADAILGWGSGKAVTHTLAVGDLVLLGDVIDQTRRASTFFDASPLGHLRQWPVFCPELQRLLSRLLDEMKLAYHACGIAAVREGPRGETPAEVRMLNDLGATLVTHTFLPEPFLARELQMAYAAVCCVTNYAETGSQHRPFMSRSLFMDAAGESDSQRISVAVAAMGKVAAGLAGQLAGDATFQSPFLTAQQDHIDAYNLPDDWRDWFRHR
jgi:5'-methylthioadenosine phosphorylase